MYKPRNTVNGKKTGNWKLELLCCTCNVRTLYKERATVNLVKEVEKHKMKCVASGN